MSLRNIEAKQITDTIKYLCIEACTILPKELEESYCVALEKESSKTGQDILKQIIENANIAKEKIVPICQDTGMTVIFIDIGQDVHIVGGNVEDAINEGVRIGYREGYLRKSVVIDPIDRINTNDNTPAIIHYNIVEGDKISIIVAPKGFGSENMSGIKMLKPSDGIEGVKEFIIDTVSKAGPNPCPPLVVGVGVGGTMEKAAIISKKALLRCPGEYNDNDKWADVEKELLENINALGIGPAGFGGDTTALAVNINTYPTHIAGLPVAVNICCHAARHAKAII